VHEQLNQLIAEAETTLDTDSVLAASIKRAGNCSAAFLFRHRRASGSRTSCIGPLCAEECLDDPSGFYYLLYARRSPLMRLAMRRPEWAPEPV